MNGEKVQEIFGRRAEGYVGSASHADQEVLERVGRSREPVLTVVRRG